MNTHQPFFQKIRIHKEFTNKMNTHQRNDLQSFNNGYFDDFFFFGNSNRKTVIFLIYFHEKLIKFLNI